MLSLSGLLSQLSLHLTPQKPAAARPLTSAITFMYSTSDLSGHTALFLHAHPDDEAIFTGITMRRLVDAGARIVLVLATAGDLGSSRLSLRRGESIAARRIAELERSAELLGVSRLVLLGRRDSGLPGWASAAHPRALAGADPFSVAHEVAELAFDEGADTLVYDDESGIYGHPDHMAVHLIGSTAAAMIGATGYRMTVDRERLRRTCSDGHLVHGAARAASVEFGRPSSEISLAVTGSHEDLSGKYAAITAHASQVDPVQLPHDTFAATYGTEWYRRGAIPGLLDRLAHPRPAMASTR